MSRNEGSGMSASELAAHFGQPITPEVEPGPNDIYKINGRVKNLARKMSGGVLTPVGDVLCNTMSHVLKGLYEFAETLPESDREKLRSLLAKAEELPGDVIVAGNRYVRPPKKE